MGGTDQASRLRQLVGKSAGAESPAFKRAKVIAVTSGKGGVGKTNVAANLAISIAALGQRVGVVDADYALANIDILLGFSPRYTIEHVLSGERAVGEIIVEGPGGIRVVPATSGIQDLSNLNAEQQNKLFNALQVIEKHFQHLLIDTAAGISDNVINILRSSAEVLVVTNPEPPAFVDSYALIKHLLSVQRDVPVKIIVNSVSDEAEALGIFDRIASTLHRFQGVKVRYLGYVLEDECVRKAVKRQRPFVLQYPSGPASRCIAALARKVLDGREAESPREGFWQRLKSALSVRTASV